MSVPAPSAPYFLRCYFSHRFEHRFSFDFGSQNQSKIDKKSMQKRSSIKVCFVLRFVTHFFNIFYFTVQPRTCKKYCFSNGFSMFLLFATNARTPTIQSKFHQKLASFWLPKSTKMTLEIDQRTINDHNIEFTPF